MAMFAKIFFSIKNKVVGEKNDSEDSDLVLREACRAAGGKSLFHYQYHEYHEAEAMDIKENLNRTFLSIRDYKNNIGGCVTCQCFEMHQLGECPTLTRTERYQEMVEMGDTAWCYNTYMSLEHKMHAKLEFFTVEQAKTMSILWTKLRNTPLGEMEKVQTLAKKVKAMHKKQKKDMKKEKERLEEEKIKAQKKATHDHLKLIQKQLTSLIELDRKYPLI